MFASGSSSPCWIISAPNRSSSLRCPIEFAKPFKCLPSGGLAAASLLGAARHTVLAALASKEGGHVSSTNVTPDRDASTGIERRGARIWSETIFAVVIAVVLVLALTGHLPSSGGG